ncbi:MAG: DUF6157 family protein [bacterium]
MALPRRETPCSMCLYVEKGVDRDIRDFQSFFRITKRYGWGVHSNADGKVAVYEVGSKEYNKLAYDKSLKHVKAMRSKRG